MGITTYYYYWYFDELHNSIRLNHTSGIWKVYKSIPVDPNLNKDTKTYTSIADAMKNAPKFAEQINV